MNGSVCYEKGGFKIFYLKYYLLQKKTDRQLVIRTQGRTETLIDGQIDSRTDIQISYNQ